jgi:hypothetical protein
MKGKGLIKLLIGTASVLALATIMFFPTGCSNLLPTEPDALSKVDDYGILPPFFKPGSTDLLCEASASRMIYPEGGVVLVKNNCMNFEFIIPEDALVRKVKITVQANYFECVEAGAVVKGLVADFGPDGLVFLKPASLILHGDVLEAAEGDLLTLYWYNPDSDQWEIEQEAKVINSHAAFSINHFSRYAIKH